MDAAIAQWQATSEHRLDGAIESWAADHGGSRQSLEIAGVADDYQQPVSRAYKSDLCDELTLDWAMGLLSSPQVYRFAQAGLRDMHNTDFRLDELEQVARIGDGGLQNCVRNFRKIYELDASHMPDPLDICVPLWDAKNTPPKVVYENVSILLASDLIHSFYNFYPAAFNDSFLGGGPEHVAEYWRQVNPNDPRLISHPLRKNPLFAQFCVPLGIHGDGVPWKKSGVGQSLNMSTVFSLLARGLSTWDMKFLLWAICNDIICTLLQHGVDTMGPIYGVGQWDFWQLLTGVFDPLDPWGEPWPPR